MWEFAVKPYKLTGKTQWGLDEVLKECKDCVDDYVDDCIIFSDTLGTHIADLQRVLGQLQAEGFTLRGLKCSFGISSTTYLGFEHSGEESKKTWRY